MFDNAVKWLRRSFFGAFVAYFIVFGLVYGFIWFLAEPIGLPDNFENLPEFIAKKRIFFHLLLSVIITSHIIVMLLIIELNYFKGESVEKYGIKIHHPRNGDDVLVPFRMSGSYTIKPTEGSIRILEFSIGSAQYWIKNEVLFDELTKQWFVERVHIGGEDGEKKEMSIAYIGDNGKDLVNYFDRTNQLLDCWIGIKKLSSDIKICDKVIVKLKIPPSQN